MYREQNHREFYSADDWELYKALGNSIKTLRVFLEDGSQSVSPDDIERLFSKGMEDGAVDAYNYATFFVLLKEACFKTKNPAFEKFNQQRIHDMLNVFLNNDHHFLNFTDQLNGIQEIMILFSLAKMGYSRDVWVIYSLLDRAAQEIEQLNTQAIANALWAAAVFNKTDYPAIKTFVEAARDKLKYLNPDNKHDSFAIDQIYRFHFVSKTLPEVEDLFSRVPLPNANDVSGIQRYLYDKVRTALPPPQIKVTLGKFIREIRCELDIAVECGELRFDIECDGPHHAFRRLADNLNDKMKGAIGWEVFRIDTSNNISLVLDPQIAPVISEIRRKLADVIPDILEHDAEPKHPAEPVSADTLAEQRVLEEALAIFIHSNGGKMRVYMIAKHLGIDNRTLVERMQKLGINVSNHMSTVFMPDVQRTLRSFYKAETPTALG